MDPLKRPRCAMGDPKISFCTLQIQTHDYKVYRPRIRILSAYVQLFISIPYKHNFNSFFLFWPLSAVSESVGFIGLQRLKPSPTPDGTFMSYKWRCGKKERKMKYIFGICNYVLESHFVWFVLEKCCYIL